MWNRGYVNNNRDLKTSCKDVFKMHFSGQVEIK